MDVDVKNLQGDPNTNLNLSYHVINSTNLGNTSLFNVSECSPSSCKDECKPYFHNEYCQTDVEYLDSIRDYVFPSTIEWVFIILYALVFIIGLVGNFLICFAVWRNNHLRTVTNYFIVNLAVADFMVSIRQSQSFFSYKNTSLTFLLLLSEK